MGRPREHDETTRTALLEAAEELVARGEPMTVRALADATSTTTRAVYSLFGNMEGLQRALLARGFSELGAYIAAVPTSDDPHADLIEVAIHGFRRFALEQRNRYRVMFERVLPATVDDQVPEATAAILQLAERVRRLELGRRSSREVTWQFHSFSQGLASVEMYGWLGPEPERMWREALDAFLRGLATAKPRRGSGRSGASR